MGATRTVSPADSVAPLNGYTFITDTICYDGATQDLAFGDVDDDDDLDLAVVGHGPDFVCINDGTGHFTETRWIALRLDSGTWSVDLGDADGDGDLDIAAGEDDDYPIELYLNNGFGYFTETPPLLIGPAWDSTWGLAWGDVDCDGDLDLATGNWLQQTVVYFNDPVTATDSITFSRKVSLGADSPGVNAVAFGDVDGDGDLDLAVGSDGGQNAVYLNTVVGTDVAIVKSSQQPFALGPGDRLTYTLAYTNNGPCEATDVVITDVVPITLTIKSVTSNDAQIKFVGDVSYTWQIKDLPPGTGGIITITGIVSPSASGEFSLTNEAFITATSGCRIDMNLSNNTSIVHNIVDAEPPDPPTLTSPTDGTLTNTNALTLTWQASPSPDVAGYWLDFNGETSNVGDVTQTTTAVLPDGVYTWTVAAYDGVGNANSYTDVWSFTVDTVPPTIIAQAPISGAVDVHITAPVIITFSEKINAGTFSHTVRPDLGGWAAEWGDTWRVVALTHHPFAYLTTYTVIVSAANDLAGNPLSDAPYSWQFTVVPCERMYLPLALKDHGAQP